MQLSENHLIFSTIFSLFIRLFQSEPTAILDLLHLIRRLKSRLQGSVGIYDVLNLNIQLELCDVKGEKAIYTKKQQVRFLQDNVIAYQDVAWGEGDIFAEYRCSPGIEADRYQEGHRYRVLISLREVKNRGDEAELNIERVIQKGFKRETEYFQTEIDHWTDAVQISILFPYGRQPRQVSITEQNTRRTEILSAKHFYVIPDGRLRVSWDRKRPRLHEAYILQWHW